MLRLPMSYKVAQSGLDRLPSFLFRERWAVKGAEGTAKAATPLTVSSGLILP